MTPTPAFRRFSAILPGLVLVIGLAVSIYDLGGGASFLRDQAFDLYQRILPREAAENGIHAIHVDIDAETARKYGAWPWPRKYLVDLVRELRGAGATTILIDAPVSDADPTNAIELLKQWRPALNDAVYEGFGQALARLPNQDRELATLLTTTKSIVSFAPGKNPYDGKHMPARLSGIKPVGGEPRHYTPRHEIWRPSLPLFEVSAKGNGAMLPDGLQGRTIRMLPLLTSLDGTLYPSNVLEALRVEKGGTNYRVKIASAEQGFSFEIEPGIESIELEGVENDKALRIPTMKDGSLRLYYGGEDTRRSISAISVLNEEAEAKEIAGRIVVVGVSANGSTHLYDTPMGIALSGGAIVADAINQILSGHFLTRPGWAGPAEQGFILLGGILIIFAVRKLRSGWAFFLALLLIGGAAYGSWWAYENHRWLIDPVLASMTLVLATLSGTLMARLHREDETRFIEAQFGRRLSSSGLARMKTRSDIIRAEGALRDVSSLVVGLRGFNIISDRYLEDPIAYTNILNRFFSPMTKIVQDRNGMVDRTVGDSLYAVWNAPLDAVAHASKACDAALRMVENLEALNEFLEEDARRQNLSHVPLSLSIGIDSGNAITGNMGAVQRFDYGVMGEPVSFAAYLQKNARNYGPAIIVGEGAQRAVGDRYALLEIDLISMPRHPEGRRVYALLGDPIMRANPKFRALQEAHTLIFSAYRNQRWAEARAAIAQCRKLNGAIPTLYDFYENRIAQYEANPPGPHWNGSFFAGRI